MTPRNGQLGDWSHSFFSQACSKHLDVTCQTLVLTLDTAMTRTAPVFIEFIFLERRLWPTQYTCLGALCNITNIFPAAIHKSTQHKGEYDMLWRALYYV